MDRNLKMILIIDTLAVAIALALLFLISPYYQPAFKAMGATTLALGGIAVLATLVYYVMMGNTKRQLLIASIVVFGAGAGVAFINWFGGGLIALVALFLLFLSKENTKEHIIPISLIFAGFSILAVVPPAEALVNYYNQYVNYGAAAGATALILVGIYLSYKKEVMMEVQVGYLLLSLIFLMVPSFHEVLGIRSNGSYGIYDMAIILMATLSYVVFAASVALLLGKRDKMEKEIERGYKYLEEGDWLSAYSLFKNLYAKDKDNENILNGMAIALMRMGMYAESEDILKKLLKIKRRDQYLVNLGNLFYRRGDIENAMKVYEEVIKRNPKCYMAMNNLARCYIDKGDYKKAEKLLKDAMAINPKNDVIKSNFNILTTSQTPKDIDFEEAGLI